VRSRKSFFLSRHRTAVTRPASAALYAYMDALPLILDLWCSGAERPVSSRRLLALLANSAKTSA